MGNIVFEQSKVLFDTAKKLTPGGIHSNVRWIEPHPMYFSRAEGCRIWDVDGNEYLDCVVNFGALILGHKDPDIIQAVKEQLDTGLTAGLESELSIETAKKATRIIPCAEMVRFSNSGTEAVMHAIQIARGYTGKERVLKAEGNYHGWYDYIFCSNRYSFQNWQLPKAFPSSQGLCADMADKTLVVPWNDIDKMKEVIEQYKEEIAAVIIEPVAHNIGCALPKEGYLEGVRELTEKNNILLIFDEVITGFRAAPGGAQEYFGVTPDLATFGKALANGFPISLVAGKKK
jgi:glutamate-1-semialdehyde 2,1-aminomutase